ncbi:regulatory protein YycH of two-component signal transduction system YycFG [Cytobacillus eiseniae]|uniref:Regulatory protein YycH of two-component signal transduction system YycFG n=1 Tax=Cytobacillus eiseniae TaxID=762947 RepID=A0ABS4RID7_9BACI|nr:two-component system activity regulator YycH [Cytobacillus eiseniae]MBP2242656.1 regulatory protein YycH of two-component signal transduction system YycFG [Cytobacillus eiseniae]
MTYENIKSAILIILVCSSVLLTWSIWTYQPNVEVMDKQNNTVEKVAISDKKEVEEIVKPERIYYHQDKERHFGTVDNNEIKKVIAEISRWNFTDFENVMSEISNYSSFIHQSGHAVIVFPDSVPIDLYRSSIDIKEKELPNFHFDRIVIDVEGTEKEQSYVYFVSSQGDQAYRSHVASSFVHNFNTGFFKNVEYNLNYDKYFSYQIAEERLLFLPVQETKMLRYQYLSNPLDAEKYKYALFTDPSVVQKNFQSSGEEYKDYSSLMRVNNERNTLSYVNPVESSKNHFTSNNLLKRSIDFINEHGGWTGDYRYVDVDESTHDVLFRLYESNGYPIFSEEYGISEISHTWGQNEIIEYSRSNFSLGTQIDTSEVVLQAGHEIIDVLEGMDEIKMDQIQDVVIGYTMKKDSQTVLVHLEPSWYYKYHDSWSKISVNEMGGGNHGLE